MVLTYRVTVHFKKKNHHQYPVRTLHNGGNKPDIFYHNKYIYAEVRNICNVSV